MSVVLRDDSHKYFLDWNKTTNELKLTEWDYVHSGNKTILQLSASYSVGMGMSGLPIYGSWYDDASQTPTIAGTATPMLCGHGTGNGITKLLNKNFQVQYSGVYNIQFSVQLDESSGAGEHIYIWFRKNGVDIPYSASEVAIQGTLAETIPSWNFVLEMNAGDYITIMYSVSDTRVYLKAVPPNSIPGIPSVIITMFRI